MNLLTIEQAAEALAVSTRQVRRIIAAGDLQRYLKPPR